MGLIVLFVVLYASYKKVPVFDKFVEGSKESFDYVLSLFPSLLGMILCINIIVYSGVFSKLFSIINFIKFPSEILLLGIMRPISSSSSLAILSSIYNIYGPDSFIGIWASILQGSTDTTIYILTIYFGSVGIKKIRYSLLAGLLADLGAFFVSYFVTSFFL